MFLDLTTTIRPNSYRILLFFLAILTTSNCYSQKNSIGHPFIVNYTKIDHHAGIQNWDINQSQNGTMLFANNGGLLTYDGKDWQVAGDEHFITRKIFVDSLTNIIYVGGQNVFGYYRLDQYGLMKFTNLSLNLLPKDQQFGDIWQIEKFGEAIIFKSARRLFLYKDNTISVKSTDTYFSFIGNLKNKFVVFVSQKGFFELTKDLSLRLINNQPDFIDEHVVSILPLNDKANIMFTEKNGLFYFSEKEILPFKTTADKELRDKRITTAILLPGNQIAIGTQFGGVLILDNNGILIETFSTKTGLLSDYNRCLFIDRDKNLWAGQEKGIEFIGINLPFRNINQQELLMGIGYTAKAFNNYLYFGTSTGLYYTSLKASKNNNRSKYVFKVSNSEGQVWGLDYVGDQLLMSHHDGIYNIVKDQAIKMDDAGVGAWSFAKADDTNYLNGNYRGIALYTKDANNRIILDHQYENYDHTTRNHCFFDNRLWVDKSAEGLICIEFTEDYQSILSIKNYNDKNIFIGDSFNPKVLEGELYCLTKNGLLKYSILNDSFSSKAHWNNHFTNTSIKILYPDEHQGFFFLNSKSFGHIDDLDDNHNKDVLIEGPQDWFVGGFEFMYNYDDQVFLATEDGFVLYDHKLSSYDRINLEFSSIIACNNRDNCQHTNIEESLGNIDFPNFKSIKFEYISPHFTPYNPMLYKCRLLGYEQDWSPWSKMNSKEYNGLPVGDYTFEVMSKTKGSNESVRTDHKNNLLSYNFEVLPVWYLSKTSKLIYFIFFCVLISTLVFFPKKKYEKEKEVIEIKHEKIIEEHKELIFEHKEEIEEHKEIIVQSEHQLAQLKTEKLQDQIEHKNKELMSITMHLTKKNEIIENLKSELEILSNRTTIPQTTKTIKKLVRVINRQNNSDQDWNHFTKHFDQVHASFFEGLKNKHDGLTPRDIRLSAYLSLNLSTKEISPLLGISVRGVESSRYRLRKKMNLDKDDNLIDYLMQFQM